MEKKKYVWHPALITEKMRKLYYNYVLKKDFFYRKETKNIINHK